MERMHDNREANTPVEERKINLLLQVNLIACGNSD
jgi:hypothetical protein